MREGAAGGRLLRSVRSSACVLTNLASTYILATPLRKDKHPSAAMAGDKTNPSKVDATTIDVKYEDIPEERRKQFEA